MVIQTRKPSPSVQPAPTELSKFLAAMMLAGNLKDVPRTGWVRIGVSNPESVADHSFRVALLCFYLAPYAGAHIDAKEAAVMGLVHDWHESICGDISKHPDHMGMAAEEKERREMEAAAKIATLLPAKRSKEYLDLLTQVETQHTPIGLFVKDMDLLEMCLTTFEYETGKRARPASKLDEFWDFAKNRFKTPLGKQLFADLHAQRPQTPAR